MTEDDGVLRHPLAVSTFSRAAGEETQVPTSRRTRSRPDFLIVRDILKGCQTLPLQPNCPGPAERAKAEGAELVPVRQFIRGDLHMYKLAKCSIV